MRDGHACPTEDGGRGLRVPLGVASRARETMVLPERGTHPRIAGIHGEMADGQAHYGLREGSTAMVPVREVEWGRGHMRATTTSGPPHTAHSPISHAPLFFLSPLLPPPLRFPSDLLAPRQSHQK